VVTAASKNEPILLGGGEIGFTNKVPTSSKIPVTTTTSKDRPLKKSKLDQELSGERIQEDGTVGESVASSASVVVTYPETGLKRIQQGKYVADEEYVADKVTGKRVVPLSMGPEYWLAQMFPGVPPGVRDKHRFNWKTATVPDPEMPFKDAGGGSSSSSSSSSQPEWLRSKLFPLTHRPNWNDVQVVRTMLSLLDAALEGEEMTHVLFYVQVVRTMLSLLDVALEGEEMTHVMFCTESCVPVAKLREVARAVLWDEACPWIESRDGIDVGPEGCENEKDGQRTPTRSLTSRPPWADSTSGRPSDGSAPPEEAYFPTTLSLASEMKEDKGVSRRSLTHARWDERARDHRDRARPRSYDGKFDDRLVARVRGDGCLLLRKVKEPMDLEVWEDVVVRRKRGGDAGTTRGKGWEAGRGRDYGTERDRDGPMHRDGEDRSRSLSHRDGHDSRRRYDSRTAYNGGYRERDRSGYYDSYRKRQRR
ncbi:hypothetical protein ACHAWF_003833, partial [Thalassiosira exigua]